MPTPLRCLICRRVRARRLWRWLLLRAWCVRFVAATCTVRWRAGQSSRRAGSKMCNCRDSRATSAGHEPVFVDSSAASARGSKARRRASVSSGGGHDALAVRCEPCGLGYYKDAPGAHACSECVNRHLLEAGVAMRFTRRGEVDKWCTVGDGDVAATAEHAAVGSDSAAAAATAAALRIAGAVRAPSSNNVAERHNSVDGIAAGRVQGSIAGDGDGILARVAGDDGSDGRQRAQSLLGHWDPDGSRSFVAGWSLASSLFRSVGVAVVLVGACVLVIGYAVQCCVLRRRLSATRRGSLTSQGSTGPGNAVTALALLPVSVRSAAPHLKLHADDDGDCSLTRHDHRDRDESTMTGAGTRSSVLHPFANLVARLKSNQD